MRRAALAAALLLAAAEPAWAAPGDVELTPLSPTRVENCIPLGDNTSHDFTGIIYRNVPAFTLHKGDVIAFDTGSFSAGEIRRDIYFARANKNPVPDFDYRGARSNFVRAVGWTQVVSTGQRPKNALGNAVVGDYELEFKAEADFEFPGGGLVVGFGEGTDTNCDQDQVMVVTNWRDLSRNFYARFYFHEHLTDAVLDPFPARADMGELWGMVIKPRPSFLIDVTTFIPGNYVAGPHTDFCFPEKGRPRWIYYAGDDRGFSSVSERYRTTQRVEVIADAAFDKDGLVEGTEFQDTGFTEAYASDAIDDGRIDEGDHDDVLGDCHLLQAVGKATTEDMDIEVHRAFSKVVRVHFWGAGTNPLARVAAAIDWDFTVIVDVNGSRPRVTVTGDHDGFPGYEIWVNNVHVYGWDPGPFPYAFSTVFAGLMPPMEVPVRVSGELP